MQFFEFLNVFYQFGFSSNRVRLCTMRAIFEANEEIYSIKYCISVNTENKLLKLR